MAVHDAAGRHKTVQQRFDGRARRRRLHERVGKVVHHFFVAHLLPLEQRRYIFRAHTGEVAQRHAFQVGAAAFHPQHIGGLAFEVDPCTLSEVLPPPHSTRRGSEPSSLDW